MADNFEKLKEKAASAFRELARECPPYEDAEMLVGSADATVSLSQQDVYKNIDTEWIDAIERALPALDAIVRNPSVAIEDVDEVLPVELSKHITEKSIKHLAQHTNFILSVKDNGEVVPQKVLNVYHDETLITYENKFINTLLARLSAFVDKRYRALMTSSGIERNYKFEYKTEFEHLLPDDGGKNLARIQLNIELTSPLKVESEANLDIKDKYVQAIERVRRINTALVSYRSSAFAQALGKNYVRPPVVRTNMILKNKNFKECLTLWEFIESFDRVGYTVRVEGVMEKPSDGYVSDLYSSVALQYANFYGSVVEDKDVRLLSDKHLFDLDPDFDMEFAEEEIEDYQVYDSEYKKTVPVSRLMNNRKKLSEDEKRIHRALVVALKADEILNAEMKAAEQEMRRLERQRRIEEEERRRAEEAERERILALLAQTPIAVRYRRSFLSRYIQASEGLQGYYGELKNKLLAYDGVKSRISWKADRFYKGRKTLARMDVRGKRVYLYLALDPKEFEGTKYRLTDVSDKKPDTPLLMKIRGSLNLLHAKQLIDILAEKEGLKGMERTPENYALPYETDDALIVKGLIRVIFPKGIVAQDGQVLTKENLNELFSGMRKENSVEELPVIEEVAPEEPIIEPVIEPIAVRYRRSFLSRYIQADEGMQRNYSELKNTLLGYKGVKARISWKAERFNRGRDTLAKIDVRGKRIYLYLALDPKEFEGTKYRLTDVSDKKPDTPLFMKIRGARNLLHAKELIATVAEKFGLTAIEREAENYAMPYETDDVLIEKGLIKVIYPRGITAEEGQILVKEDVQAFFEDLSKAEPPVEVKIEETPVLETLTEESLDEVALAVDEELEKAVEPIPAPEEIVEEAVEEPPKSYANDTQGRYDCLRDALLSHGKVVGSQEGRFEAFFIDEHLLARLTRRWGRVHLYLALDPADCTGKLVKYVKKFKDTPVLIKVKGEKSLKEALSWIERLRFR